MFYLQWWEKEETRTAPCSFYFQTNLISINSSLQLMPLLIIHYTFGSPFADSNIDVILILASKTFPGAICYPIVKFNAKQHQRFSCNKRLSIRAGKSQINIVSSHADFKLGHNTSRRQQNLTLHLRKQVNGFQFVTGFQTTNWMQQWVVYYFTSVTVAGNRLVVGVSWLCIIKSDVLFSLLYL